VSRGEVLVVGANRPLRIGPIEAHERQWSGTVHAVDPAQDDEPYRARCGGFVLFLFSEFQWPPGLVEDCCPACVRLTERLPDSGPSI
jgi:hypothetical protein